MAGPGRGAAVIRIKGTTKALVATTDGNAPVGALDPWLGAAMSVAEAARNVSITGARPLGVTNCLNYGDPTRPEAFWQLAEAVRGLADACVALGLPVTGGNVSLYNEAPTSSIAPTPEIGIVGLLADVATRVGPAFRADGNAVLLVGDTRARVSPGSEYARLAGARARRTGRPALDLERERQPPGVHPRGDRARPRRELPGRVRRRPRRRPGGDVHLGRSRGAAPAGRRGLAGGGAVRREPVAAGGRGRCRATCRRSSCWPATTACRRRRWATTGGTRLVIELAGEGATGAAEERGSRIADALEVPVADLRHAWEHGLPRALGWEGDGEADHAAEAALPGAEGAG